MCVYDTFMILKKHRHFIYGIYIVFVRQCKYEKNSLRDFQNGFFIKLFLYIFSIIYTSIKNGF